MAASTCRDSIRRIFKRVGDAPTRSAVSAFASLGCLRLGDVFAQIVDVDRGVRTIANGLDVAEAGRPAPKHVEIEHARGKNTLTFARGHFFTRGVAVKDFARWPVK